MKVKSFQLRPNSDYIDLLSLLKVEGIAQTGGHAKLIVESGEVSVNGEQELRKRRKLRVGDLVELDSIKIQISAS